MSELAADQEEYMGESKATLALPEKYEYSFEDFLGTKPYEDLCQLLPMERIFRLEKAKVAARAKNVKFFGFEGIMSAFIKEYQKEKRQNMIANYTEFGDQIMELCCEHWVSTDRGIYRDSPNGGKEYACAHAIMPIRRLVNIDTGEVKIALAYKPPGKYKQWRTTIVDKTTIATSKSITALASQDIAVTSSNASVLVDYLNDMQMINYDTIEECKSIGRLGYIPGEGFSPYVEGLVFDGDASFRNLYGVIKASGSVTAWFKTALECRKMSVTARIMLAASFASPILSLVGSLPFFVHLWGVDSGTGKTVALMLAASVWGNPALGSYIQTFNATQVGQEKTAAFLNHLPYCMDELQLTKDSRGKTNFDVYQLAQGVGRTRGKRNGGVELTPTWSCCFLTTGESPLTGASSGAGAVNRVIDIECSANSKVIEDGQKISGSLKRNYGFAGPIFVEKLYRSEQVQETVRDLYQQNYRELMQGDSTEKQAMAAAAIITADQMATAWIFKDGMELTVKDIREFLASREAVSAGKRAYDWLCDWVASNVNHFLSDDPPPSGGELYGALENGTAYIIRGVFDRVIQDAGYSTSATLSYLRANGLIDTRSGKGYTKTKRIGRTTPQCVWLHLEPPGNAENGEMLPL